MAVPPPSKRRTLGVILLVAAVGAALVPGVMGWVRWAVWYPTEVLFLVYPAVAGAAFALALTGFLLLRTRQVRDGPLIAAVVLLGMNLVAAAWSSWVWFTSMTCSGGYSGPCFGPFIVCGGGFLVDIIAIAFVAYGLSMTPRAPAPSAAGVPPPAP